MQELSVASKRSFPKLEGILIAAAIIAAAVAAFLIYRDSRNSTSGEYSVAYWIALISSIALAATQIVLALSIYRNQEEMSNQQALITVQLRHAIFGTLSGFEDVYQQVVRLIEEANQRETAKLSMMVYWVWFGVDQRVRSNPNTPIPDLKGFDSRFRQLISTRLAKGYDTTMVLLDPAEPEGKKRLCAFVKAAIEWQRNRAAPPRSGAGPSAIQDSDVEQLVKAYETDLSDIDRHIATKAVTGAEFKKPHKASSIPMLMFAASDRDGWKRGLVFLGEHAALATNAETGGFVSQDPEIVKVIVDQIDRIAAPSTQVAKGT